MADKRPKDFTPLTNSQITLDTQLYTQVPGGAVSEDDYRFTVGQLLSQLNILTVASGGPYISDDAAGTGGVSIGQYYELAINNIYGIPIGNGGVIKKKVA